MTAISRGFCECGCGERTKIANETRRAYGHVKGEPLRYVHGHHRRRSADEYIVAEQTGCWLWQRATTDSGYGVANPDADGERRAHRVVYKRHRGPIPAGLDLDHLCHTADESCPGGRDCPHRRCVNPEHLEPVEGNENRRRAGKVKLTADAARAVRTDPRVAREVAAELDVTPETIRRIRNGTAWRDA